MWDEEGCEGMGVGNTEVWRVGSRVKRSARDGCGGLGEVGYGGLGEEECAGLGMEWCGRLVTEGCRWV